MNKIEKAERQEVAAYGYELILDLHGCDPATFTRDNLGRFDDLLHTAPCCNQVNKGEKCLAQFVITRRNTPKLLEATEKAFDLLA